MPDYAAATVQEFRDYARIASTAEDQELAPVIAAATHVAEFDPDCGIGPILQRSFTRRVLVQSGYATLPVTPAVSLTSFVGARGADTYTAGELDLDKDLGIVRHATGWLNPGPYDATWTAGRVAASTDVEASQKEAVLIIAKHLWETRRGRGRGGALAASVPAEELIPMGFLVPHRAKSLLRGSREWIALG